MDENEKLENLKWEMAYALDEIEKSQGDILVIAVLKSNTITYLCFNEADRRRVQSMIDAVDRGDLSLKFSVKKIPSRPKPICFRDMD